MADRIFFNVRERPLSTDWNNLQAMNNRTYLNLLRYAQSTRRIGAPSAEAVQNVVVGGLLVTPSGSDVSISPGVLLQDSAVLAPVPTTYDSTYRIAALAAAETLVMPSPGGTTYYLIEAQLDDTVTVTTSRDILDPGTGTFIATSVPKEYTSGITFQLLTGGASAPAPSGGDWVPIAIVRRPGGGGAVAATDIIDVRQYAEWSRERPQYPVMLRNRLDTTGLTANYCAIEAHYDGPLGQRTYLTAPSGVDVTAAAVISPSTVLAANTKFYLYLAPWSSLSLNPKVYGSPQLEGVLVLSSVAPSASGFNSALLDLPAPYAVAQAAISSAYLIGTLLRNALNTGWAPMTRSGAETLVATSGAFGTSLAPPVNGANAVTFTAPPPTAKQILVRVIWGGGAGAAAYILLTSPYGLYLKPNDDLDSVHEQWIGHDGTGGFTMTCGSAPNAGTTATVTVCGWRE